jgi:hypothetical protein
MPETQTYGFEYETPQSKPGITLTGDIDGTAPILAEQVDAVIGGIDSRLTAAEGDIAILQGDSSTDTGWLALSGAAGTGFTVSTALYRLWGPIVSVKLELQLTGANITAGSNGNVIGDPVIYTINTVNARPSQREFTGIFASITSGGGSIQTSGDVQVTDLNSNSAIETDDLVRVSATYFGTSFS